MKDNNYDNYVKANFQFAFTINIHYNKHYIIGNFKIFKIN